jgi:hypothetical protein
MARCGLAPTEGVVARQDSQVHSVEHLAGLIDETVDLLKAHGEAHWAEWLEADARAIRARDGWGLEHFLAAFGGSGSLMDLVFHPVNGNASTQTDGQTATDRLHELLDEAYPMAQDLARDLYPSEVAYDE